MTKDNRKHSKDDKQQKERNPLDAHADEMFVDEVPMKDLKIGLKQERNKHKSQDDSQSARKYQADFKKDTE